jgi:hypothetical protein
VARFGGGGGDDNNVRRRPTGGVHESSRPLGASKDGAPNAILGTSARAVRRLLVPQRKKGGILRTATLRCPQRVLRRKLLPPVASRNMLLLTVRPSGRRSRSKPAFLEF